MLKGKTPQIIKEMVKFGMVGATSLCIDTLFLKTSDMLLLKAFHATNVKHLHYIAIAIGCFVGSVNGYLINSRWTFRYDTKGVETKKFGQFATISAIGLALTELIMHYLMYGFGCSLIIAKLLATPIVFFWNFSANRLWTFKKVLG